MSSALAKRLFAPLLLTGAASVVYWYWSERRGMGDLRPYVLVQFGSLLVIVLLLILYRGRSGDTGHLAWGIAAYVVAKVFELADQPTFALVHFVSGHTLKHIAAAAGLGCIAAMIHKRK